jgi:hypothetical protein
VTLLESITFGLGLLGSVLGVMNTWRTFAKDRVKLRVVPRLAFTLAHGTATAARLDTPQVRDLLSKRVAYRLSIEAVNLSSFPIVISEVGFGRTRHHRQTYPPEVVGLPEKTFPTRLEPREAVQFLAPVGTDLDPKVTTNDRAYVETDCGVVWYGKSPAFSAYLKSRRNA